MRIRRAILSDIPAMAQLLEELFRIEDDFTIDSDKQMRGLQLLVADPDCVVLIGISEDRIIGMVSMQSLISTVMGERVGMIEDMIVTRDHRGCGIGASLLSAVMDESKRLGYARLTLGADTRNHRAVAFYQKYGFNISHMGLMYRF